MRTAIASPLIVARRTDTHDPVVPIMTCALPAEAVSHLVPPQGVDRTPARGDIPPATP